MPSLQLYPSGYNGGIPGRVLSPGKPKPIRQPIPLSEPQYPAGWPSLGILALFIEHHNLIHTEYGAGSGNLASQVGAKLGRLGVVKNGAR